MTPRRLLLTGAAGFVGAHMAPALRRAFPDASLHEAAADVTDADALAAEVAAVRPDACVHLAAIAAVPQAEQDPDAAWRVNLGGTLHLARAIQRHAPECVLLFASSADVYGRSLAAGLAVDETALLAPSNVYAASKAAADLALGAMAGRGLRVVRVRAFNHTGPGQSEAFVVPAFARQAAAIAWGGAAPVLRVGNLDAERDFLDVRDVCAAYVACLRHAEAVLDDGILNIASGAPRRLRDVMAELLALAGIAPAIEQDPARMRPSDIPRSCGDATRARRRLCWNPVVPWDQTLRDVLDYWRGRVTAAGP
jgi:GDP-4-dehydro-6-deoxy-D-mannose reductase